jgi:pyruvate kinase
LKGDEGMFVIDYNNIHEKLKIGDKVLVDYGGMVMTIIGFESEEKYIKLQQKKEREKKMNLKYFDDSISSSNKKR